MKFYLKSGAALSLALAFASPACAATSCSINNANIDLGKVANLKNGIDGVGNFGIKCSSDAGGSGVGYCLYIQDGGDLNFYRYGVNPLIKVPFTFLSGKTGGQLGNTGGNPSSTGPLYDWTASGTSLNSQIIAHIEPQGESLPEGEYENAYTVIWAAAERMSEDNFISSCQSWNGRGAQPSWANAQGGGFGFVHIQFHVAPYCSVETEKSIDFGQQALLTHNIDQTGAIKVDCSMGTRYAVTLGKGNHYQNGSRAMKRDGGEDTALEDTVSYGLFKDAGYTDSWGETGKDVYENTSQSLLPISLPVYARILPQAGGKAAGVYRDTVIVTIKILGE